MIVELKNKERSRKLYEEAFDDAREFVDYYYEEKCRDNRIIANVEDGEVISMLHLNPYHINLYGKVVKSYYVVAVATAASRRREGQMARLFERTFELLEDEHIPFVFLMPVDEAVYSWMGFEKICDFTIDKIAEYDDIIKEYDVFCVRDSDYIRRMEMEDVLKQTESEDVLPVSPIIMAKITDLEAFKLATGNAFGDDKEAMEWLKNKKTYICEEV